MCRESQAPSGPSSVAAPGWVSVTASPSAHAARPCLPRPASMPHLQMHQDDEESMCSSSSDLDTDFVLL